MNRTDVILPEFTRVMWVSDKAESVWKPRISAIGEYISEMERQSCLSGRVSIQLVNSDSLPKLIQWASENKLTVLMLNVQDDVNNYVSSPVGYNGGSWSLKVAICPDGKAESFMRAWMGSDNREIGNKLAYPPCCARFFERVWVRERFLDTTWPMALSTSDVGLLHHHVWLENSPTNRDSVRHAEVRGYPESNIMLRWAGVRAVPHLPCSFNCVRTKLFADWFNDKERQEYQWIIELLSMSIEWSALHGIARIKTPLFEVSTRTDHTDEKYTVRREGSRYPAEGARGLVFPFWNGRHDCHTPPNLRQPEYHYDAAESRSDSEQEATLWTDNGFGSTLEMNKGHAVILQVAPSATGVISVHDLGCGNGLLLERLRVLLPPTTTFFGVDTEVKKWRSSATFNQGDLLDHKVKHSPSLGIISANRFRELGGDVWKFEKMKKLLSQFAWIIVYSYNNAPYKPAGWTEVLGHYDGPYSASLFRSES